MQINRKTSYWFSILELALQSLSQLDLCFDYGQRELCLNRRSQGRTT